MLAASLPRAVQQLTENHADCPTIM
jgi:hypothetical protein